MRLLLSDSYGRAKKLLETHRKELDLVAQVGLTVAWLTHPFMIDVPIYNLLFIFYNQLLCDLPFFLPPLSTPSPSPSFLPPPPSFLSLQGLLEYESLSGGEIVDIINGNKPNVKGTDRHNSLSILHSCQHSITTSKLRQ